MRVRLPRFITGGWGQYEADRGLTIRCYERERLASNLRLVDDLVLTLTHVGWLPPGPSPLEIMAAKQREDKVPALAEAVKEADAILAEATAEVHRARAIGDGADLKAIAKGIRRLVDGLLALWPWSASPLIMSAETAFEGISQV